ncbi:MAG TPA: glycerophosphodiester phosphodiesterase, partial [Rubrivivax sp.]|nr:glycerophosphodiester phosphodiesterase [Rubrivivax sp.]
MTDSTNRQSAWPLPRWIAHRGAGKLAPENTLAAFRLGASHGYRAFECDAKLSADGVPLLLHDATLDRTTSGQGLAANQAWQALSRLDAGSWHGPAYAGEPIPTLQAVARYCLANEFSLNIEIKPTPGQDDETGRVVAAHAAAWWAGAPRQPLLSSFSPAALAAAQRSAPVLPRALLLDALRPDWLPEARQLDCVGVVFNHTLLTRATVQEVQVAGMQVACYTVNDAAIAERLLSW